MKNEEILKAAQSSQDDIGEYEKVVVGYLSEVVSDRCPFFYFVEFQREFVWTQTPHANFL